jgi:hypothetical protein
MLGLSIPLKYPNRGFGVGSRATVTGYRRFGTQRGSNVDMPLTGDDLRTTNLCGGSILNYVQHRQSAVSGRMVAGDGRLGVWCGCR